jgi:hypothetical protein
MTGVVLSSEPAFREIASGMVKSLIGAAYTSCDYGEL